MAHSSDRNRWCARVISDWDGRGYGRECLSVVEGEQLIVSPYIFVHTHIYIYIYINQFFVSNLSFVPGYVGILRCGIQELLKPIVCLASVT